jgi:hypothetical protein
MFFSFLLSVYGGWRQGRFAVAAISGLFTRPEAIEDSRFCIAERKPSSGLQSEILNLKS